MAEQNNTPELRFPEFRDKWSIYKLFEVLKSKTEGMKRGPFGGALKKEIFVEDGYAVYEQRNAIYDNQDFRYFIDENKYKEMILFSVLPGDIIMSCSGTIGRLSLIPNNYREGVINQALIRFRTNNAVFNNYFLIYMRSMYMQRKMLEINPGSAITNLIPVKELKLLDFPLPSLDEQEKISDFFSKLDRQIELEEKKLELLEQQKKGYMQKIFSQELRFKDKKDNYYSDWKNCQLKDLTYYKNGKGYEKVATTNGKYNIINLNSIGIKGQLKNSGKYTDFEDDTLLKNDLIMILSDVAKGNLIGMTAIIDENNKYLLNQRIALLRIKNSLITNAYFLYLYINFNRKYFINMSAGMSQLNINKKTVEDFPVNLPNIEEQNKIAILFKNYGDTIKKQASKVKLLKQRKQGLLQKMFV